MVSLISLLTTPSKTLISTPLRFLALYAERFILRRSPSTSTRPTRSPAARVKPILFSSAAAAASALLSMLQSPRPASTHLRTRASSVRLLDIDSRGIDFVSFIPMANSNARVQSQTQSLMRLT